MQFADPTQRPNREYENNALNENLVGRYYTEILGQGRLEVVDEIISPDITIHAAGFPQEWLQGREGMMRLATEVREAFPDISFALEKVNVQRGMVEVHWTMRGTHMRKFLGIPPSGDKIHATGTDIFLMSPSGSAGRMVEYWHNWDEWGMVQRLRLRSTRN